jgi:hypothetical protein
MLRYYPASKVITNLVTKGQEFAASDGSVYSGKYYLTYDGKAFSGPNPEVGPSNPLKRIEAYPSSPGLNNLYFNNKQKKDIAAKTGISLSRIQGKPVSYYPQPTATDYKKGYVIRYFTKKENEKGYIVEISESEYNSIVNGTADYNTSMYQTTKILWKITGPLKSERKSQYNVIPGIIDTNQRLTESANKTFLGIVDFIGGEYTKFAIPTM